MKQNTELSKKMIIRADLDGLPQGHVLRESARTFDAAASDYYAEPPDCDVKKFIGAWARARRVWSEYSGEALI